MNNAQLNLEPKTIETAAPSASEILTAAQKALGFVPNMYGSMALSPALLATYMTGYTQFRENTSFSASEQEIVFLTVSRENTCDYCVAAHSMIAEKMSGVSPQTLEALRTGGTIENPKERALSEFTSHLLNTRGRPNQANLDAFLAAGFKAEQVLDIVLAISVKTLSNYSNHMTSPTVDAAFASHVWEPTLA